ncbi:MAG: sulfite exporter TauE/SafE family protein [Deltaproteobacteria bacterium]|nr:sulfite exporter TauE/SafE family protein [Deltaproteobacteria bacterium]
MESTIYLMIPLFFLTALIYSSVGFGGGSTYLALLVLFAFPFEQIPRIALICNLVVVSGGLCHYIKNRQLSFKAVIPFAAASVPMAYVGGMLPVGKTLFLILLGISLMCAGLRLLFVKRFDRSTVRSFDGSDPNYRTVALSHHRTITLPLGAALGFLSGLTGLGGGIFLAPILYFLRWGDARQIAAMSCFFIFVNSLAGLIGQFSKNVGAQFIEPAGLMVPLVIAVFLGGQIGTRLSLGKLAPVHLQRITAILILSVAAKIFWGFL